MTGHALDPERGTGMQVQSWWHSCQLSFAKRRKKRVTTCGKSEWRQTAPKLRVLEVRGFNMARGRRMPVEGQRWRFFFLEKKKGRNTDWCHSSVRTIPENSRSDIRQSNFCKSERSHRASVRTHFYLWRQDVEGDQVHQLKQTKERTQRKNRDQKLNLWSHC